MEAPETLPEAAIARVFAPVMTLPCLKASGPPSVQLLSSVTPLELVTATESLLVLVKLPSTLIVWGEAPASV